MSSDVLYRRATLDDCDEIVAILRAIQKILPGFKEDADPDKIKSLIELDHFYVTLGTLGGSVVGCMLGLVSEVYCTREIHAYELVLYVDPSHRKTDISVTLLAGFEQWAKSKGATQAWLGCAFGADNDKTKRFYERAGYNLTGFNGLKGL
jgi:GNAT superfamily N-acetyltransferase